MAQSLVNEIVQNDFKFSLGGARKLIITIGNFTFGHEVSLGHFLDNPKTALLKTTNLPYTCKVLSYRFKVLDLKS